MWIGEVLSTAQRSDSPAQALIQRCPNPSQSLTLGQFHNSNRARSHYVGLYWQPWAWGSVRLGAVAGFFDGYPHMLQGGWFPAVIPVATVEGRRFGINLAFVPPYQDRLYGALSFQLKLRLD